MQRTTVEINIRAATVKAAHEALKALSAAGAHDTWSTFMRVPEGALLVASLEAPDSTQFIQACEGLARSLGDHKAQIYWPHRRHGEVLNRSEAPFAAFSDVPFVRPNNPTA